MPLSLVLSAVPYGPQPIEVQIPSLREGRLGPPRRTRLSEGLAAQLAAAHQAVAKLVPTT